MAANWLLGPVFFFARALSLAASLASGVAGNSRRHCKATRCVAGPSTPPPPPPSSECHCEHGAIERHFASGCWACHLRVGPDGSNSSRGLARRQPACFRATLIKNRKCAYKSDANVSFTRLVGEPVSELQLNSTRLDWRLHSARPVHSSASGPKCARVRWLARVLRQKTNSNGNLERQQRGAAFVRASE